MAIQINGTSGISGVDGSAGTPALQGTDSNTGISFGTDTVNINTGGTTRATVSSTGRLGVGTASPSVELHVSNSEIARVGIGSSYPMMLYTDSSGAGEDPGIFWISSKSLRFSTSPTGLSTTGQSEKARIDSSGRLLVGTSTAPSVGDSQYALVSIQGNTAGSAGDSFLSFRRGQTPGNISSGAGLGTIVFGASDGSPYATIAANTDGTGNGGSSYPGRLAFFTTASGSTSPTERMRIAQNGTASVYGTPTDALFTSRITHGAGTSYGLFSGRHSASNNVDTGTNVFYVYTNGNVVNTNNSYGALSDIKLKENIVDAGPQWDDIKALQVRKYNFKEGQTHTQIGLVAQEAELVSPGLVYESPDRDDEGNDLGTVTKSVNYSVLYMKAVKALQEAMERIETLETRVAQLEGGAS